MHSGQRLLSLAGSLSLAAIGVSARVYAAGVREGRDSAHWDVPWAVFAGLCLAAATWFFIASWRLKRRIGNDRRTRKGNVNVLLFLAMIVFVLAAAAGTLWVAEAIGPALPAALIAIACIVLTLTIFGGALWRAAERARKPVA